MAKLFVNKDASLKHNKNFLQGSQENFVLERSGEVNLVSETTPEHVFKPPNKVSKAPYINKLVKHLKLGPDPKKPFEGWRINIASWSDVDKNTYMCWGDHWVKVLMEKELQKLGCITDVELNQADITIYLFGSPFNFRKKKPYHYNPLSYNIVWFYSHPEKFSRQEAARYDYIHCLSKPYLELLKKANHHPMIHPEPLYSCTNFRTPEGLEYGENNDIVMVANARGAGAPYGREVIKFMAPMADWLQERSLNVKVWGHKWDNFQKYSEFPKQWYAGKYIDYESLPQLYRRSKAVIIDGHAEMEQHGFVPMKIFDVFASGGLPIIKRNKSTEDLFGSWVPQYDDKKSLKKCFELLYDRDKCQRIIEKGKKIAIQHTYKDRVLQILNSVSDLLIEDSDQKLIIKETKKPQKKSSRIEFV